ncbi:uncharacterized protein VTP21DRAFT_9899 [Calcarisporiella thermophila]|uniref:uncharacterized protein n=1 Tax=Calcarisporiella thermophila TaxID=911321 RepID=UPI00374488E7
MGNQPTKLDFRRAVLRLFEERNISPLEEEFWAQFWALPDDIFSVSFPASDVRRIVEARENLETLLKKVIERLLSFINVKNFPSEEYPTQHLLNCIRVLTRLMPFVFESKELCHEWENNFFWTEERISRQNSNENNMVEDYKDINIINSIPSLGERLIAGVISLMFFSGFTIPSNFATENSRVNYVIWESGVGASTPIGSSKVLDSNKAEILQLFLVLMSKSIYMSPSEILSGENKWIHYAVAKTERKIVLSLLCSLLNTAVKYNPLGWGIPYNHVMFADQREHFVILCLQTLVALLDYRTPGLAVAVGETETTVDKIESPIDENMSANFSKSPPVETSSSKIAKINYDKSNDNAFRFYTGRLHSAQNFQFITDGILTILSNPMQANNTYLPGSTKHTRCYNEMLILCWKLLEVNKRFRDYLLETDRVLDLLVVLLYYILEYKLDHTQLGLVSMCVFMLQTLSADRNFGIKLNNTFYGHASLPPNIRIPAFHGTYADFLIISIHTLIATTKNALHSLYPALILTITNISPYVKQLSASCSNKLIALFSSFTTPTFLLSDQNNFRLAWFLTEALGYIIEYHLSDNPHVAYAIVLAHQKFEGFASMTLPQMIKDAEQIQALRERKRIEREMEKGKAKADRINSEVNPLLQADEEIVEGNEVAQNNQEAKTDNYSEQASKGMEQVDDKLRKMSKDLSNSAHQTFVGRDGFVFTEEWFYSWHPQTPLQPIISLIEHLLPRISDLCAARTVSDQEVLDFIRQTTLVGLLPPPRPVHSRKFQWNDALTVWFRSMLWSKVYVASMDNLGIWNGTAVRLFTIKTVEESCSCQDNKAESHNH